MSSPPCNTFPFSMQFLYVPRAKVLKGLNFMAPAYKGFRTDFVKQVNDLQAQGATNYQAGEERGSNVSFNPLPNHMCPR